MDVDWRVPIAAVREKYMAYLATNDLWGGRAANMVVTDAVGDHVNIRFLMSAEDSDRIWTLRCDVREAMVKWLQEEHPDSLPLTRVSLEGPLPQNTA